MELAVGVEVDPLGPERQPLPCNWPGEVVTVFIEQGDASPCASDATAVEHYLLDQVLCCCCCVTVVVEVAAKRPLLKLSTFNHNIAVMAHMNAEGQSGTPVGFDPNL